jgi:hypothetical protein
VQVGDIFEPTKALIRGLNGYPYYTSPTSLGELQAKHEPKGIQTPPPQKESEMNGKNSACTRENKSGGSRHA